jgi:cold shock protein
MNMMRSKTTPHHKTYGISNGNTDKQTGTVKFFNVSKKFGFIIAQSGAEYFVHAKGLKSRIRENDRVAFELKQGPRGMQAVKVSLA